MHQLVLPQSKVSPQLIGSLLYSIFSAGALAYEQCLFSTRQKPTECRKLSSCLFELECTTSSEECFLVSRLQLDLNDADRSLYYTFFIAFFLNYVSTRQRVEIVTQSRLSRLSNFLW